jgi:hypothetical protein
MASTHLPLCLPFAAGQVAPLYSLSILFWLPRDSFTSSCPAPFQSNISLLSNKYTVSMSTFLLAVLPLQTATFMTSFSYFLPNNLQQFIAQLKELKVKLKSMKHNSSRHVNKSVRKDFNMRKKRIALPHTV